MNFIKPIDQSPVRLKLQRDRTRSIKQGYPWIYQDWLEEAPQAPAGSRAMVRDRDGSLLAFGMYDPESPLAVRVCAVEQERLDDALVESRLKTALMLRRRLFSQDTTGFRLLNGEGDGLPGLVCDIYGSVAVLKLDGAGPAGFWNLSGITDWLRQNLDIATVYLKHRSDAETRGELLWGKLDPRVTFLENAATFEADIVQGQKTGFFFDQRDNRRRIQELALDKRVLNLFSYTGGFSVFAGIGGASHVTSVDLAKPAIVDAEKNWTLNKLPVTQHRGFAVDVFEFLTQAKSERQSWDLIVVDPPSFAPAERHVEQARESYISLFTAALQVGAPQAVVALSSCSSHISPTLFHEICQSACSKAKRRARVIGVHGQPADHPFPLACLELQYLKFTILALS